MHKIEGRSDNIAHVGPSAFLLTTSSFLLVARMKLRCQTAPITLFSELWPPRGFSPFFSNTRKLANTAAQRQAAAFPPLADQ
jgi:hypothetical protein